MEYKDSKIKWIILSVVLIIIGGIGGHFADHFISMEKTPRLPEAKSSSLPNLQPPKVEDQHISGVRNTAIVQAVKQVAPAVVGISTQVQNRDMFTRQFDIIEGVGSGVIFDERGYIVTNNHVVEHTIDDKVSVFFADGTTADGLVIGRDQQTDLAVVKVDKKDLPVAVFGNSDDLVVGEPAIAIGSPLGLEFQGTVTTGIISSKARTIDAEEQRFPLLQTDAAINPGNSGGALINAEGYVIGINSSKIAREDIEGIGFAIPINQARPVLEDLINHGHVVRPYLGVLAIDRHSARRYGYNMDSDGLIIVRVVRGGPIEQAGLEKGDVITALDGKPVHTLLELKSYIDTHHVGDDIVVTYMRNGKERTATVTLALMPEAR